MDIKKWLQEKIAEECGIEVHQVSCTDSFDSFSLDSLSLISLTYELENLTGLEIHPTVFSEFNNIDKLTEWISRKT